MRTENTIFHLRQRGRSKIARVTCLTFFLFSHPVYAETFEVRIISDYQNMRFAFLPEVLEIQSGDTVTWINEVAEEHNVISYPGGFPDGADPFQSPYLQNAGETFSHTFTFAGTYQYHCLPHLLMGMKGEIVVDRRSIAGEFHKPNRDEIMVYRSKLLEWFDEDDNLMEVRMSNKETRPQE